VFPPRAARARSRSPGHLHDAAGIQRPGRVRAHPPLPHQPQHGRLGQRARPGALQPVKQPAQALTRADLTQDRGGYGVGWHPRPAVTGHEPHVRQEHRVSASPYLMAPAAGLEQLAGPGQRLRHHRIGQPGSGLDVHHLHRLVGMDQQEIGHVTADPAADRRAQQERLRRDRLDAGVEVGQQQPGQLQPALVYDVPPGRRRPVIARVARLAASAPGRPPRCRPDDLAGRHLPQRALGHCLVVQPDRHRRLAQPPGVSGRGPDPGRRGCGHRTVRRWANGSRRPRNPGGVWDR
jgi:hypothetical protein